jgi:putative oxidoreductase
VRYVLTVLRVLLGASFLLAGVPKLSVPGEAVSLFERWGLPFAEAFVPAVGVLEVVAGTLLVLGVATRSAAALLAANMLGAILTAGVVDGGLHLVVPPILGALCVLVAVLGGGAWQLRPLDAGRGGKTTAAS